MNRTWLRPLAIALGTAGIVQAIEPVELPAVVIKAPAPESAAAPSQPVIPVVVPPNPLPAVAVNPDVAPTQLPAANAASPECNFLPEPCQVCRPRPLNWAQIEYLHWWMDEARIATPFFTTATTPGGTGVIGAPGTAVAFGNNSVDLGGANGVRLGAGRWLNPNQSLGLEIGGFLLEKVGETWETNAAANGSRALFRPVQVATGGPAPTNLALPIGANGGAFADDDMRLWGIDANAVFNHADQSCFRFDSLVGFRYVDLSERLTLGTSVGDTGVIDVFDACNQFYGPQVGGRLLFDRGRLGLLTTLKVGLGVMHESLSLTGQTQSSGVVTGPGFLVGPSNTGRESRDRFAAVPELGVKVIYRFTESAFGTVGYDVLYLSDVIRPGENVTTQFTPTGNALTPVRAAVSSSDAVFHGLAFGLGVRY